MRNTLSLWTLTLLSGFIVFSRLSHPVYAQTEAIEPSQINQLRLDPRLEVPEYKLMPVPTPVIKQEPFLPKDDRAWVTSPYRKTIEKSASTYNLDPQLLYATIMTESEGNEFAFRYEPNLKDASFCMGQILLSTARSLGFSGKPKDLYNPEVCINLIGKYYRTMLDTHGNLTFTQLAKAYNSGSPYKRAVRGHIARFSYWYGEKAS